MSRKTVSSVMLVLLVTSMLVLAVEIQPAKAMETITINADGSITPSSAPITTVDNITYTLTADIINESIVVQRENIVLDGAGYTLQGSRELNGIDLSQTTNVTVENLQITDFDNGVYVTQCMNTTISRNNIVNNNNGILFSGGSNNTIVSSNNITANGAAIRTEGWTSVYDNDKIYKVYHNNFLNNAAPRSTYLGWVGTFFWNLSYPSGGNYWSDYQGIDSKSGSYQNESGSDGIGDSPYTYSFLAGEYEYYWFTLVQDYYPLTTPFGSNLPLAFPNARFTYAPLHPLTNQTVIFNASTTTCMNGTIVAYIWNFGDGGNSTGQTKSHVYAANGKYNVTLTAISSTHIPDTENQTINVQQPPMPLWEFWTLIIGGASTIALVSIAVFLFVKRIQRIKRTNAREHLDKYLKSNFYVPQTLSTGPTSRARYATELRYAQY